jgi:hypothetical protein
LTRSARIKLNERVSLRSRVDALRLHNGQFPNVGTNTGRPPGDHIRLAALFLRKKMTNSKAQLSGFRIYAKFVTGLASSLTARRTRLPQLRSTAGIVALRVARSGIFEPSLF